MGKILVPKEFKLKFLSPVKSGKYAVVTQYNADQSCLDNRVVIRGYYRNPMELFQAIKKHKIANRCSEVPGSNFKVMTKIIGNGENPFFE